MIHPRQVRTEQTYQVHISDRAPEAPGTRSDSPEEAVMPIIASLHRLLTWRKRRAEKARAFHDAEQATQAQTYVFPEDVPVRRYPRKDER